MRSKGILVFGLGGELLAIGCSSSNSTPGGGDGGTGTGCANAPVAKNADYCKSCTRSPSISPAQCTPARNVDACCAWVQSPTVEIARSTGLHYYSGPDATPDVACLTTPASQGTSQTVTLKGFVKLFSNGADSAGVKVEIFKEGTDGALGALVGTAFVTQKDDAVDPPFLDGTGQLPTWLSHCPTEGCKFRSFTYPNVPTETPLIIKTSDAAATGTWSELYDYNIYFANDKVDSTQTVHYDPSAVAATDLGTVAAAVGIGIKPDQGLLAGEVHDCSDSRISGATVDTDLQHEGPMFYFTDNEADPLPDQSRTQKGQGTSRLGLFGALNIAPNKPLRITALGKQGADVIVLGTYVVQTFPNAVTAISLRGRRPFQK